MILDELAAWFALLRPDVVSWTPSGTLWTAGDPQPELAPITISSVPVGPDRCVTLAVANVEIPVARDDDEVPLQIRTRGGADASPAESAEIAEELRGVLLSAFHVRLPGGTWLAVARPHSGRPGYLGPDGNRRHQHIVNARLLLGRSTT